MPREPDDPEDVEDDLVAPIIPLRQQQEPEQHKPGCPLHETPPQEPNASGRPRAERRSVWGAPAGLSRRHEPPPAAAAPADRRRPALAGHIPIRPMAAALGTSAAAVLITLALSGEHRSSHRHTEGMAASGPPATAGYALTHKPQTHPSPTQKPPGHHATRSPQRTPPAPEQWHQVLQPTRTNLDVTAGSRELPSSDSSSEGAQAELSLEHPPTNVSPRRAGGAERELSFER
jgi:hypothetical protein